MAYTFQNLIDEALQVLRVIGPGESLSSAQYADLVRTANLLLDDWNAEEEMQGGSLQAVCNLTAGKSTYKIGPAETLPDIQFVRPLTIDAANVLLPSGSIQTRIPLELMDIQDVGLLNPVDLPNTPYPRKLYYGGDIDPNGAGSLFFWPTPSQATAVELILPNALGMLALSNPVIVPPAYQRAMVYNFAIAFAPKFGKVPTQDIVVQAMTGLQRIRTMNYQAIKSSGLSRGEHWDFRVGDWITNG